jgi:hypothetical protein
MPNSEHLNILRQGVDNWNAWRDDNPTVKPDLSDVDLLDRSQAGACWDEAKGKANLSGANLKGADLQRARMSGVIFRKVDMTAANLTEAELDDADCRGVIAVGTRFNLVEGRGIKFQGARLDGAVLVDANWCNASFVRASLEDTSLRGNLVGADLRGCDAYLKDWRTTLTGVPDVPLNYPTDTPIESIVGLDPHTRRMVADGVYIKSLWDRTNSLGRLGLRLWGVTCGYGQSLSRWIVWSLVFVLLASVTEVRIKMNIANHHIVRVDDQVTGETAVGRIERPDFEKAVYHTIVTFATLGYGDITPVTFAGRIWVIIVVCGGYIMLGGLVSIFATKLGRLS